MLLGNKNCLFLLMAKIWNPPFRRAKNRIGDFSILNQKISLLWENPWKILAENSRFPVRSCIYEKVRTFFKENPTETS